MLAHECPIGGRPCHCSADEDEQCTHCDDEDLLDVDYLDDEELPPDDDVIEAA